MEKQREEQKLDLDNIEEPKLFSGASKASGLRSAKRGGDAGSEINGQRTANFSATTAGRSTHMTAAAGLSRAASNQ